MNNLVNNSLHNFQLSNTKNLERGKYQIWHQAFEPRRDDIVDMSSNHEERVRRLNNILSDEERIKGTNKNSTDNVNKFGIQNKNELKRVLPDKVQNNINETRKLNQELKKGVDDISKMNAIFVVKQSDKYFKTKSESDSSWSQNSAGNYLELPKINAVRNNSYDETEKTPGNPGNFRYINDNYRAQLMRAFLNFNPIIHLNNLRNLLEKADPAIKQDINNLWQTIERDLKEVLDPLFYKKKYERIILENKQRIREKNALLSSTDANLYKLKKEYNHISHKKSLKNISQNKQINDKKKVHKKPPKEKYEVENVKEFISLISRMTNDKKLESYIDTVRDQSDDIHVDKHFNAYFKEMKAAEEILKNIQSMNLKSTDLELRETKNNAVIQNDEILKTIQNVRNILLKDLTEKK